MPTTNGAARNATYSNLLACQSISTTRCLTLTTFGSFSFHPTEVPTDPICCSIRTVDLKAPSTPASQYLTLSYPWGETNADGSHLTNTIYCDGNTMKVTANLNAALKGIRHNWRSCRQLTSSQSQQSPSDSGPFIWVDAICINQDDAPERSHTVAMMDEIYKAASMLMIFPGELSEGERQLFSDSFSTADLGRDIPPDWSCPIRTRGRLMIARRLVDLPWFTRRWVIQEYHLSPKGRRFMLIGSRMVNCHAIWAFLSTTEMLEPANPLSEHSLSLIQALHAYEKAKCSVLHDRVYALMHICESGDSPTLKVEYSTAETELYFHIATTEVKRGEKNGVLLLQLLALATCRNSTSIPQADAELGPAEPYTLPSWVPNWNLSSRYQRLEHRLTIEHIMDSAKSVDSKTSTGALARLIDRDLVVIGCRIPFCPERYTGPGATCAPCSVIPYNHSYIRRAIGTDTEDACLFYPRMPVHPWYLFVLVPSGNQTDGIIKYRLIYCVELGDRQRENLIALMPSGDLKVESVYIV